jgi:hypothetical protein
VGPLAVLSPALRSILPEAEEEEEEEEEEEDALLVPGMVNP